MKDALGHGSDPRGGSVAPNAAPAPATYRASDAAFPEADRAAIAAMTAANGGKPLPAHIALGMLSMIHQHRFEPAAHQQATNAVPRRMY